jgi:hypothetical protein
MRSHLFDRVSDSEAVRRQLTPSKWAQASDHKRTLARTAGICLQINNTSPAAHNCCFVLRQLTIHNTP